MCSYSLIEKSANFFDTRISVMSSRAGVSRLRLYSVKGLGGAFYDVKQQANGLRLFCCRVQGHVKQCLHG